ncbi:hypothetical protein ELI44_04165 [Rhizobium ruizarguesonis]|nr:hypothetical protein ELI42_04140 [Rhizobium ruizarguesonis]TAU62348.1 hypothetical protein ELI44_04165 [Rhizobium ruizarguesonis]
MPGSSHSSHPSCGPRKRREEGRATRERGGNGDVAACPFAPFTGRRWRQPDEGQAAMRRCPCSKAHPPLRPPRA